MHRRRKATNRGGPGKTKPLTRLLTLCYNGNMENKFTSLKVMAESRALLKIAAAIEGVPVYELVHRLAVAELARVQGKQ